MGAKSQVVFNKNVMLLVPIIRDRKPMANEYMQDWQRFHLNFMRDQRQFIFKKYKGSGSDFSKSFLHFLFFHYLLNHRMLADLP